jgi:hypothetical protein
MTQAAAVPGSAGSALLGAALIAWLGLVTRGRLRRRQPI